MTRIAVRRQRRQLAFLVVTGEAGGMRQRSCFERTFVQPESVDTVLALRITVFVLGKHNLEVRNEFARFYSREKTLTATRKRKSSHVVRCGFDVAVQTDARHWPLAREELLPMTAQAGFVLWIFRHVGKSVVRLPCFFPVLRRERMT